jgi:glycerol-3-phosphate dehydrogenase (NAD(P)+)
MSYRIGAGSWGTTLAHLLSNKGYEVTLWAHEKPLAEEMRDSRVNSIYLPDVRLPDDLKVTSSIEDAVKKARYVVSAVPAQYTRAVFTEAIPHMIDEAILISVSKGIEKGTLLTVSSILKELTAHRVAVLSGPSFAKEVIRKLPAAVTCAAEDSNTGVSLQEIFNTNSQVYTHDDIPGVELGGALKNVMAVAAGISDSLGSAIMPVRLS